MSKTGTATDDPDTGNRNRSATVSPTVLNARTSPHPTLDPRKTPISLAQRAFHSLHPTFNRPVLASTRLTRILLILPIFSCSPTLAPSRHLEPSDICANPRHTGEDSLRLKRPSRQAENRSQRLPPTHRLTRNHIEAESRSHGNLAFTPSHPHMDTPLTLTSVSTLVTNSLYFFRIIHRIYFHDTEHSSLGFFGPSESPSLTRAIRS
ncbi:hypothetical protein B0H14DRAFT_3874173 [Mycena olivaceomarginata]|nr:hypothetical protein B0H14DRAFT_3874173 [Mycena olivaceomarginata]